VLFGLMMTIRSVITQLSRLRGMEQSVRADR
jgi:hypothetical protein